MAWYVGQKVVCISDNWSRNLAHLTPRYPKKDEIFTVRSTYIVPHYNIAGLRFQEIKQGLCVDGSEAGFFAECFRPVVERKTDISELEALLNPANHKHLELT
jgi:hypothetical protein